MSRQSPIRLALAPNPACLPLANKASDAAAYAPAGEPLQEERRT